MAFTVTFPSGSPVPSPSEVAEWLVSHDKKSSKGFRKVWVKISHSINKVFQHS